MMTVEKLQEANALYERIENVKLIKKIFDNRETSIKVSTDGTGIDLTDPDLLDCLSDSLAAHIEILEEKFRWL